MRYSFERPAGKQAGAIRLEVTPYAGKVPLVAKAAREVLAERIWWFGLRYYTRNKWEDKWDGEGLPRAVEIEMEIGSDDGRERRTFSTVVDLTSSVTRGF